ncbi:MAG: hypothetical protein AVDCRST_MAG85-1660, partial [uncultured Solirubrobacteraceae bacterium]
DGPRADRGQNRARDQPADHPRDPGRRRDRLAGPRPAAGGRRGL